MDKIQNFVMMKFMFGLFERENKLSENEEFIKYNKDSPTRFEIMMEGHKYGKRSGFGPRVAPLMISVIRNQNKVLNDLKKNPPQPRTEISDKELKGLEKLANKLGAGIVGYTQISPQLIFKDKALLHANAIVLGFEMNKIFHRMDVQAYITSS